MLIRPSVLISLSAAVFFCLACAAHPGVQTLPSETFSGHATASGGGTWFTPCGSAADTTKWWVTFTEASVQQVERAKTSGLLAEGKPAFVRWSAVRTDERHAGPGGPALLVRDIAEIRPPQADDCAGK